jgi:5-methylcytosine-specific restriction enzyme A
MAMSFSEAVQQVASTLSTEDRRVLQALLFAPEHAASASQLRKILGLKAVIQVNGTIGRIGRKVYEVFGAHPEAFAEGTYEWWHIIATGESTNDRGFVWVLREEVVLGLLACGFSLSGENEATEVTSPEVFIEGATKKIAVNAYERNPVARARCIEVYGAVCCVCDFNFSATYGEFASGMIQVHHIKALATIGQAYEVDPIKDLRPVCANCHAVIHHVTPMRSIEEVKSMIFLAKSSN